MSKFLPKSFLAVFVTLAAFIIVFSIYFASTHKPLKVKDTLVIPTVIAKTISVSIKDPGGNSNFDLSEANEVNPCTILLDAKLQKEIKSVTLTHYGPPINSDYVKEMNGYKDNWNFTINGVTKDMGCSNYILDKNDKVEWSYKQ